MKGKRKQSTPTPLIPPLSGGRKNVLSSDKGRQQLEHLTPPLIRGGREGLSGRKVDLAVRELADRQGFIPYSKNLTALARQNRKNPTKAESKTWNEVLRLRKFSKYKFLRQKPLAGYIVDFYCSELRLVIEVDSDSHAETAEYDEERTKILGALGLTVVRYTNDDALKNVSGVYNDLIRMITLDIE